MNFSTPATQVIEGFAAQLGISTAPSPDGSHSFLFESSGLLTFTAGNRNQVIISLARRPGIMTDAVAARALSLAGPDAGGRMFLHAGRAANEQIVFAVVVEQADFTLPTIESGLQRLLPASAALG